MTCFISEANIELKKNVRKDKRDYAEQTEAAKANRNMKQLYDITKKITET